MTTIEIKKACVVRDGGADRISLKTDLPNGSWPYKGTTSLRFEVAAGSAEEYLAANLPGVEVEVIDVKAMGEA